MPSVFNPIPISVAMNINYNPTSKIFSPILFSLPMNVIYIAGTNIFIAATADTGALGVTGDTGQNIQANPQ